MTLELVLFKYYEACNCAYGCPCNMNGFPTHGKCEGAIGVHILEGEKDGVDLAGIKIASAVKWPGAIHEGNGKMAVVIDAKEDQRDPIIAILTAQDPGLPWEILAATVSEIVGPFFETVEIEDNGTDSHLRAGDKIEVKMESFTNPVSGEPHEAHMVLPGGFIFTDGKICTTSVNKVNADGVSFDHAGNNAYYAVLIGMMNLAWMAAVAAVILTEKVLTSGTAFSRGFGVVLVGAGLVIVTSGVPLLA